MTKKTLDFWITGHIRSNFEIICGKANLTGYGLI